MVVVVVVVVDGAAVVVVDVGESRSVVVGGEVVGAELAGRSAESVVSVREPRANPTPRAKANPATAITDMPNTRQGSRESAIPESYATSSRIETKSAVRTAGGTDRATRRAVRPQRSWRLIDVAIAVKCARSRSRRTRHSSWSTPSAASMAERSCTPERSTRSPKCALRSAGGIKPRTAHRHIEIVRRSIRLKNLA